MGKCRRFGLLYAPTIRHGKRFYQHGDLDGNSNNTFVLLKQSKSTPDSKQAANDLLRYANRLFTKVVYYRFPGHDMWLRSWEQTKSNLHPWCLKNAAARFGFLSKVHAFLGCFMPSLQLVVKKMQRAFYRLQVRGEMCQARNVLLFCTVVLENMVP